MDPQIGDSVTSAVRLTRLLGKGGMGSVWLAHHQGLDTEVVVKFLRAALSEDEQSRERFLREAAATAKVHSPHVVRIFDHGVTDSGHPFMVMEYLEGEDLGRVLARDRRLSLEQVAHLVEQTGRALDAAHRRQIIHRDVKPANIFLIDVGARLPHIKLVDFGVAKANQMMTLTTTGVVVGTPIYMSPEQIAGHRLDHRSDLWSLGVVAFRALTGEQPFMGDSVAALTYLVIHGPLPLPSAYRPELPPSVDEWFALACARNPAERFASARAMADALWDAIGMPHAAVSQSGGSWRSSAPDWDEPATVSAHPAPAALPIALAAGAAQAPAEPTAGSLRSSVATVAPRPRRRWRSLALLAGIPLALAAGYGIATFRADEAPADEAAPAASSAPEQHHDASKGGAPPAASVTASASISAASSASTTAFASASASASAAVGASAGAPSPRPPRYPATPPDDLGF